MENKLPPTILVIFGITGDLSRRYVLPALVEIMAAKQLPKDFKIVGVSRQQVSSKDILNKKSLKLQKILETFQLKMDNPNDYKSLKKRINDISKQFSSKPQVIFYLLIPPNTVPQTIRFLGEAKLNSPRVNLLLEKPFGSDLSSARRLIRETQQYFKEEQVHRIDHYLAKEVAQNITVFLGSNALFRSVWDTNHIEKMQIIAAEKIGIEGRGNFYEQTGALRDFSQSHLMQLAALTLMEPCSDPFDLNQVAAHRLAALKALKPIGKKDLKSVVVGQYEGYGQEVGNPESTTETFVAFRLYSSNRRWRNVPIELITGKNLSEKLTEVRVYFKKSHVSQTNLLILRIQPREAIELDLWVKEPGYDRKLHRVSHRLDYDQHFGRLPNAYEQVLIDAMRGSHGLFASSKEVLASWRILNPIIKKTNQVHSHLKIYKKGSSFEDILKNQL
jgi:glucose-6-phosphate 1-dehydrogenase